MFTICHQESGICCAIVISDQASNRRREERRGILTSSINIANFLDNIKIVNSSPELK